MNDDVSRETSPNEEWSARQFAEWYETYSRDHMTDDELHNMREAYQAGYQQAVNDEYT